MKLEVISVDMGVNIDFGSFFNENNVDPVTISPEVSERSGAAERARGGLMKTSIRATTNLTLYYSTQFARSVQFTHLIPPNYAADYDPRKLAKEDPFISNMAAVLQINPERMKITNIVPGNGRRRMQKLMGWETMEGVGGEQHWESVRRLREVSEK